MRRGAFARGRGTRARIGSPPARSERRTVRRTSGVPRVRGVGRAPPRRAQSHSRAAGRPSAGAPRRTRPACTSAKSRCAEHLGRAPPHGDRRATSAPSSSGSSRRASSSAPGTSRARITCDSISATSSPTACRSQNASNARSYTSTVVGPRHERGPAGPVHAVARRRARRTSSASANVERRADGHIDARAAQHPRERDREPLAARRRPRRSGTAATAARTRSARPCARTRS